MFAEKEAGSISIKNMVCDRCIAAVARLLTENKIDVSAVKLGEVVLRKPMSAVQKTRLTDQLAAAGFLLLDDNKTILVEKIKNIIINLVHYPQENQSHNVSEILSNALHKDYSSLSRLFSADEGTTIEKYLINQKIERIKELLIYQQMNLNEIASELGYSSVAHLSSQFKKVTGITPSQFRNTQQPARKTIDNI